MLHALTTAKYEIKFQTFDNAFSMEFFFFSRFFLIKKNTLSKAQKMKITYKSIGERNLKK